LGEKTRVNSAGFLEGYDEETGKVLWTQKRDVRDPTAPVKMGRPRGRPTNKSRETHHYVMDAAGRKVWVPKGTNPEHIPHCEWPYNQITANHVCQKVAEGKTLKEIGRMEGFPPKNTIDHWARRYPEFKEELRQARIQRAEFYHDEVIEIGRNTRSDTHKEDRLKADIFKWGASVGDPESFGNRTKVVGDPNAPISFIIETGVPEPEKPIIDVSSTPQIESDSE
jgi:hypothetical protein